MFSASGILFLHRTDACKARAAAPVRGSLMLGHSHIPLDSLTFFDVAMRHAPPRGKTVASGFSVHTYCTRKAECTRVATFAQIHCDPANAEFHWKHPFSNSHLNVSDTMKRREHFTFNRNKNRLWQ